MAQQMLRTELEPTGIKAALSFGQSKASRPPRFTRKGRTEIERS
jgi:hypothetical protein